MPSFFWWVLRVALISQIPASQPAKSPASRPSVNATSGPADNAVQDRELGPEEKKVFLAGLAQLRQEKLDGAIELRQKIRTSLADAQTKYEKQHAAELRSMKQNENKRDLAGAQKSQTYRYQSKSTYSGNAKQDHKDITAAQAELSRSREVHSEALRRLELLEACDLACRETNLQTQFGQDRKAAIARKKADTTYNKLDWQPSGIFVLEMEAIRAAVKKSYRALAGGSAGATAAPADADTLRDAGQLRRAIQSKMVIRGMSKADVISAWGGPSITYQDHWIYGRDGTPQKQVKFDRNGQVLWAGKR